jgi:hypothetical protein
MKTDVALPRASAVRTNPRMMKPAQNALRKIIATAAALQRWEELEKAVDVQIAHQKEFVGWWDDTVRAAHRPKTNTSVALVSVAEAEQQTGISQPQVSRWRTALQDIDAYRARQIKMARRRAVLEAITRRRRPPRQSPPAEPAPSLRRPAQAPPEQSDIFDPIESYAAQLRNLMLKAMADRPFTEWQGLVDRLHDEIDDVERNFERLRAEMQELGKCE